MLKLSDGWESVGSPGYLGSSRDARFAEWNAKYGVDGWRLVWEWGYANYRKHYLEFGEFCRIYEDAYFQFLRHYYGICAELTREACDVYDDEESNVLSGLDYSIQETARTHVQDIAIRNALIRLGLWFRGDKLIRIRQEKGDHRLSVQLSPGVVRFHHSELIRKPQLEGWWKSDSVEACYQSNRLLVVRAV